MPPKQHRSADLSQLNVVGIRDLLRLEPADVSQDIGKAVRHQEQAVRFAPLTQHLNRHP